MRAVRGRVRGHAGRRFGGRQRATETIAPTLLTALCPFPPLVEGHILFRLRHLDHFERVRVPLEALAREYRSHDGDKVLAGRPHAINANLIARARVHTSSQPWASRMTRRVESRNCPAGGRSS